MSPSFLFKIHSLPFCYSNSAATKSRLQFIAYELLPLLFLDYDFDQLTMSKRLWRLQFLGERVVKTGWHRSEIFFSKGTILSSGNLSSIQRPCAADDKTWFIKNSKFKDFKFFSGEREHFWDTRIGDWLLWIFHNSAHCSMETTLW